VRTHAANKVTWRGRDFEAEGVTLCHRELVGKAGFVGGEVAAELGPVTCERCAYWVGHRVRQLREILPEEGGADA